jgi:hypothetical protein
MLPKPAHGVCKMQDRKGGSPSLCNLGRYPMGNPHLRIPHGRVGMESLGRKTPFRDPGMGKGLRGPQAKLVGRYSSAFSVPERGQEKAPFIFF